MWNKKSTIAAMKQLLAEWEGQTPPLAGNTRGQNPDEEQPSEETTEANPPPNPDWVSGRLLTDLTEGVRLDFLAYPGGDGPLESRDLGGIWYCGLSVHMDTGPRLV